MGKTTIEWTDASWNPIVGCTEVSPGCANCYAARLAATRLRETPAYKGLSGQAIVLENYQRHSEPRWTGEVRFLLERLDEPLHWRKPRRIFVCDMGDLFHESVQLGWVQEIFGVIVRCPLHTFQILTKRAKRMHDLLRYCQYPMQHMKNVRLGVSVENQHFADERIPLLLATPAAVHWISAEPLLGPVKMKIEWMNGLRFYKEHGHDATALDGPHLDWVVCGGESGPSARPMHPDWARSLRDQCQAAGVPFFFKQWGEWFPANGEQTHIKSTAPSHAKLLEAPGGPYFKFGKHAAGRLLDGREWNEFPR